MAYTLEQLQKMGATPVAPSAPSTSAPKAGYTYEQLQTMGAHPVSRETTPPPSNIGKPEQQDGFLKTLIKDPIKTLVVKPAIRTANALGAAGVYAFGNQDQKERVDKYLSEDQVVDVPVLGRYTIEGVKNKPTDVAKQLTGEALKTGSYLVGGGGTVGAAKTAFGGGLKSAVMQGAKAGAVSGGAYGAGQSLEEGGSVTDALKSAATGVAIGGAVGAAVPLVPAAARGVKNIFSTRAENQATKTALLQSGAADSRVAKQTLNEAGAVVKDKVASEAVRQGIPEADVALMKSGSMTDASKMIKMLDIRESQITNKRITDRATDVVGDTFITKIANPLSDKNKQAAQQLNLVAQRLAGKKVNPTQAVKGLADDLEEAGVTVSKKTGLLNFKNSNFEGLPGPQHLITNVWARAMRNAKTGDALQLHRTKSYIDEIVNYGKQAEGLSGKAQGILKKFRHNIDSALDTKFPSYNQANTVYSDTINELGKIAEAMGRNFKVGDSFADARAGVVMRRILSNTKSRSDLLQLLETSQNVLKKYGVKLDEDIITQANFADTLEKMLGSEAPTSFLGQIEKGLESFGSSSGFEGMQQVGSAASEFARGNVVRGTIKIGAHAIDVLRNVNQENKIKALRALLNATAKKKGSATVFGTKAAEKAFEKLPPAAVAKVPSDFVPAIVTKNPIQESSPATYEFIKKWTSYDNMLNKNRNVSTYERMREDITPEIYKNLSKYKPKQPIELYRFQRKGQETPILSSWSKDEQWVRDMAEMDGMEFIQKTFSPDEILVDVERIPSKEELTDIGEVIVKARNYRNVAPIIPVVPKTSAWAKIK